MPGARVATGETITLCTVEDDDVPFLQRAYTNPELRLPLGWDVKSQLELEADLEDGGPHDEQFLVCHAGDPIGGVVAGVADRARPGIGFWIVPDAQGEGHGRDAVATFIDYLFEKYPHPAIYANALPGNEASRGLLEALGFVEEGRARQEAFWQGAWRDAITYGLLRAEWTDHE